MMPWEETDGGTGSGGPAPVQRPSLTGRIAKGQEVGGMRPLSLDEDLQTNMPVGYRGQSLTDAVGNFGKDMLVGAYGVVRHPVDTFNAINPLNTVIDTVRGQGPLQLKNTYDALNTRPGETAANMAGASALMGQAGRLPVAMEAAGDALISGGKRVGGGVLGSNALDRQYGARPGGGISRNRIVATSRPSLKAKVDAASGDLKAEQTSVLSGNQTPVDVTGAVAKPFNDIRSKVANPRTGVADPAEMESLTRAQTAAMIEQNPATGKPVTYQGQPGGPVTAKFRNLTDLTPAEIAEYNSNLRGMATYGAGESPLADQAIKMAGHNLREKMLTAAPESSDVTQRLYDTETAGDILGRQMQEGNRITPRDMTLTGAIHHYLADPAIVTGGSTLASGLDLAGSGLKSTGSLLSKITGGQPAAGGGSTAIQAGHGPLPTGQMPNPHAQPQGPGLLPAGHQVTPPPASPAALPATAGPTVQMNPAAPPPNVRLTERVSAPVQWPTHEMPNPKGMAGEGFVIQGRKALPRPSDEGELVHTTIEGKGGNQGTKPMTLSRRVNARDPKKYWESVEQSTVPIGKKGKGKETK